LAVVQSGIGSAGLAGEIGSKNNINIGTKIIIPKVARKFLDLSRLAQDHFQAVSVWWWIKGVQQHRCF